MSLVFSREASPGVITGSWVGGNRCNRVSCWEWHQRKLLSSMKGTGNGNYFFRVCLGARCLSVYCTISLLFWIPSFPLIPEVGRWSLCGLSSTMAVVEPGCGGSLVHASVEKVACCTAGSQITPDHIPWCKQFISCEKCPFSLGHL